MLKFIKYQLIITIASVLLFMTSIIGFTIVNSNAEIRDINLHVIPIYRLDPADSWEIEPRTGNGWFSDYIYVCSDDKATSGKIVQTLKSPGGTTATDVALQSLALNQNRAGTTVSDITATTVNRIDAFEYTMVTVNEENDSYTKHFFFLQIESQTYTFECSSLTSEWNAISGDIQEMIDSFDKY